MLHMVYLFEMVEHLSKEGGYSSTLIIDCSQFLYHLDSKAMQGLGWFHASLLLLCRNYPCLFKNVYIIHGSRCKKMLDRYYLPLFENRKGFHTQHLDGDDWRDTLHSVIDKQYLPPSLYGTYNIYSGMNMLVSVPPHFHLKDLDKKEKATLTTTIKVGDLHPNIQSYQQNVQTIGTVFYCEFMPDGLIDFELYYLPPNSKDLINKKVLIFVSEIDHYYFNFVDASKPGTYSMAFTSNGTRHKRTVKFRAGIASTMEERLNHVYKIEEDDDGNVINSFNSRASFFLV
ncbi:hypothetical protein EB796_018410 [Bugula neritina]|uniref:CRAL-TRIO domain-containing protein n=1 Tax=Bugula neritina TaxID=10212 RepID=A0A7J7JBG8_BUGNE|nr:hypothetical protein EB796_018410 [Bugula neritina]